uniref:Pathogenicity protein n=1 Tax=Xanthomonas campestris TaxID=339 RepID=Q56804_XANCA|nr:pathogenicity protein [Xanthomonas campestris]
MDVRIAARDGLALLLNEDDHALRVSIAGILLADRLARSCAAGLGAAEVIAFERDAEPDDCHGIGITLGDLDAIALTASAPLLATLRTAVAALARPRHCQSGWPHCASSTRLRIGRAHRIGGAAAVAAAWRCLAALHGLGCGHQRRGALGYRRGRGLARSGTPEPATDDFGGHPHHAARYV